MLAFAAVRLAGGLTPCGKPGRTASKKHKNRGATSQPAPAGIPINYRKGLLQPIYQFNQRAFLDYGIKGLRRL
jgi:hypothetical protein